MIELYDIIKIKKDVNFKMPIIQEFIGEIDDIIFKDEVVYYATEFIVDEIESRFDIRNSKLTKDLSDSIDLLSNDYTIPISEIKEAMFNCLKYSHNFRNLEFNISGDDMGFEDLNQRIKDRVYENSKESTIE